MTPKSEEFTRFEGMVDGLLTVPKTALKEKMDAHRARVAALPSHKKRGPKPGGRRQKNKKR